MLCICTCAPLLTAVCIEPMGAPYLIIFSPTRSAQRATLWPTPISSELVTDSRSIRSASPTRICATHTNTLSSGCKRITATLAGTTADSGATTLLCVITFALQKLRRTQGQVHQDGLALVRASIARMRRVLLGSSSLLPDQPVR